MEKGSDPKLIALQFNDSINTRDIDGLANLMTDDHAFIDNLNNCIEGKSDNKTNWKKFFELFPDYRNIFETVSVKDSLIIMQGYSICSDKRLDMRGIWTAQIRNNKVKEWRVYFDTEENKNKLEI